MEEQEEKIRLEAQKKQRLETASITIIGTKKCQVKINS